MQRKLQVTLHQITEYVSRTNNTSGIMTEDQIEVIYYYRIKQTGIEQTVDKQEQKK